MVVGDAQVVSGRTTPTPGQAVRNEIAASLKKERDDKLGDLGSDWPIGLAVNIGLVGAFAGMALAHRSNVAEGGVGLVEGMTKMAGAAIIGGGFGALGGHEIGKFIRERTTKDDAARIRDEYQQRIDRVINNE